MKTFSSFFIIILIIPILLTSCSSQNRLLSETHQHRQPGDVFQQTLISLDNLNSKAKIQFLKKAKFYNEELNSLARTRAKSIVELYEAGLLDNYEKNTYINAERFFLLNPRAIELLIELFPVDSYAMLRKMQLKLEINREQLLAAIVAANLDPTLVFAESSSGLENSVTPLIHSAGIVLHNQDESSNNTVKYRKSGDNKWRNASSLVWEPIYGSLSGSLIYLDENTSYEVEITVNTIDDESVHIFTFETRPDSPPIDPNKVFYLSEIYSGGQLNLEDLNIFGSQNGYAKIIGDGPIVDAGDEFLSAVHIGRQSYVMLENLTIKGGKRYGIYSDRTHNIWIKGCNISAYGRKAGYYKNGKAYETSSSNLPINYDSGIYLEKTGVSVIEDCEIYNQNLGANHWGNGHPNGANAIQVWAYHPDEALRGQLIIRNNRLYGSDDKRFNDVIEGRKNAWRNGGFVRDSAIYGNYLAYANDDLIELDGGQRNVLFYNNELTKGYTGVSITPNRLGPSYIFHNYIHDLGDETGAEWAAIKAGGLMSQPAGQSHILENYINTNRNGLAASSFDNDNTFWVFMKNNIIVNRNNGNMVGYGIYDEQQYFKSKFVNNIIYNEVLNGPKTETLEQNTTFHEYTFSIELLQPQQTSPYIQVEVAIDDLVNSISHTMTSNGGLYVPNIVSGNLSYCEESCSTSIPILIGNFHLKSNVSNN